MAYPAGNNHYFILFVAFRGSVTVHYFKYVIGVQELTIPFMGTRSYDFVALASAYNTIGQFHRFAGRAGGNLIAKILGKKKTFCFIYYCHFQYQYFYFLTAKQSGADFLFPGNRFVYRWAFECLLWAMYADTADYAEWKKGRRATGLIFSASTMSQKFGWAFGAFLALNPYVAGWISAQRSTGCQKALWLTVAL
jgi:glycoside/pentoside/hexuronide:cation symporter, GPH family